MTNELLYFDDIRVGQRFVSDVHLIDEAQIRFFAEQFDPQPFHTDPAVATASFFGELVASGWHTAAITMRLLVTSGLPIAGGLIGRSADVSWPRPTRPGSELRAESEVVALVSSRSRPDRGMATVRTETKNQHDEVVQILTSKLILPRRNLPS